MDRNKLIQTHSKETYKTHEGDKRQSTTDKRISPQAGKELKTGTSLTSPETQLPAMKLLMDVNNRIFSQKADQQNTRDPQLQKLLETPIWKDKNLQLTFADLIQKTPGTDDWSLQASNLTAHYMDLMKESGANNFEVMEKGHILSKALKAGGDIYIEQQNKIESQKFQKQTFDKQHD